jgi:hypothetical protein
MLQEEIVVFRHWPSQRVLDGYYGSIGSVVEHALEHFRRASAGNYFARGQHLQHGFMAE